MTDLRKAVKMALEAFEQIHESCGFVKEEDGIHKDAKDLATEVRKDCNKYTEALRQALEQAEKPWVKSYCGGKPNYCTPDVDAVSTLQERVDETVKCKREWVGLTDEEIMGITCECVDDGTFNMDCARDYARWIEDKLKEKNYGLL